VSRRLSAEEPLRGHVEGFLDGGDDAALDGGGGLFHFFDDLEDFVAAGQGVIDDEAQVRREFKDDALADEALDGFAVALQEVCCKEFAFCGRPLKEPMGRTGLPVVALAKTGGRENGSWLSGGVVRPSAGRPYPGSNNPSPWRSSR
jgi:hypothetical protein